MLVAESRPRDLDWKHSGPLLFGDWGTSRLYVLGLAFYYTGHASPWYLAVMSVIMAAVAWAYTIVCRCFPDGGGVYTASRHISKTLSVVGATLLLCDFIVTAALSGIEAFHYFGTSGAWAVSLAVGTMVAIGVVNWYGARSAGRFALIIATVALVTSAFIGVLCLPMAREGLGTVKHTVEGVTSPWQRWESLVRIVLALSGVEAVANMTGLMKQPVARTAKRTIWPVLIEVVILNFIFGLALNALPSLAQVHVPDYVTHEVIGKLKPENVPEPVIEYRDTAVRVLAEHAGLRAYGPATGHVVGIVAGIVFGLLLLSAVNTAIMAMVSVLYSLGKDRELPKVLTRLNYSGVPWVGLIIAAAAPAAILVIEADAKSLGELYAIGVVGAIAINVVSCAANRGLAISAWERRGLWALGGLMSCVEATIVVAKPNATIFAGIVVGAVLAARFVVQRSARVAAEPLPTPAAGWLAELKQEPVKLPPNAPRIMLAARGRDHAEYAVDLARKRGAALFAISVRTLRLMDVTPGQLPRIEDDPVAQETLGTTAVIARKAGVPFVPIYVTATDIAAEILDYTVTFGCDTVIMGKTRRALFARTLAGDVVAQVAAALPEGVSLVTRSSPRSPADYQPGAEATRTPGHAHTDDEPPPS